MLNIANDQRNANKNYYNEVSPCIIQKGHHQSLQIISTGKGFEKRKPSYIQLVGMQIGAATMENSMEVP